MSDDAGTPKNGANTLRLPNVGNLIRTLILVFRNATPARIDTTFMDPIQQKVLQYMPVAFAVMFVFFPAGLVLYWTVSNLLQIAQQWQINRMLERDNAAAAAAAKR